MNPDVKLSDFTEFFGKTKDELLKGKIACVDNSVKRYLHEKFWPQSDVTARVVYEQIEYSAMFLGQIGENYFSSFESQAKDIENKMKSYNIKDDLCMRYGTPLKYINKDEKILDYGCGQAVYPLILYFMGYHNITLADISNHHFKFLEFLCKKYGIDIKFIPITGELASTNIEYDYIICSDVLEHCWDPIKVLGHIVSRLKKGKLIYISDFYDDAQGTDPSHLRHNFRYQNVGLKIRDYSMLGIQPFLYDQHNSLKVWKKNI